MNRIALHWLKLLAAAIFALLVWTSGLHANERQWIVVLGSYPHADWEKAVARQDWLASHGIAAEIVDTDDHPNLSDGLYAIILGPLAREAAEARLGAAKRLIPDAYLKADAVGGSADLTLASPAAVGHNTNPGTSFHWLSDGLENRLVQDGDYWREYRNGTNTFTFVEQSRDENFIYVLDHSRNVEIALPIGGGLSYIWQADQNGWSAWMPMTEGSQQSGSRTQSATVRNGVSSEVSDAEIRTALAAAAQDPEMLVLATVSGDTELLSALIEAGGDVNAVDAEGWTPLAYAAAENNFEAAKLLVASGAYLTADRTEDSPLVLAAVSGSAEIARLLLQYETPAIVFNEALSLAAGRGDDRMVQLMASMSNFSGEDIPVMVPLLEETFGESPSDPPVVDSAFSIVLVKLCRELGLYNDIACLSPEAAEEINAGLAPTEPVHGSRTSFETDQDCFTANGRVYCQTRE